MRLLHPWDSLGKNTGVGCHAVRINRLLFKTNIRDIPGGPVVMTWPSNAGSVGFGELKSHMPRHYKTEP